jgi:CBS domain-containing protein
MLVKDVMSSKPEFLPPTATLKQAADQMYAHDYGFIPVGENDRLIGVVTDRDITIRGVAKGKDPAKTMLKEVMTEGIAYCFESDHIEKAVQLMEKQQIRRLAVLNEKKRLTGVISLGDIATKCKNAKLCGELADAVSHH